MAASSVASKLRRRWRRRKQGRLWVRQQARMPHRKCLVWAMCYAVCGAYPHTSNCTCVCAAFAYALACVLVYALALALSCLHDTAGKHAVFMHAFCTERMVLACNHLGRRHAPRNTRRCSHTCMLAYLTGLKSQAPSPSPQLAKKKQDGSSSSSSGGSDGDDDCKPSTSGRDAAIKTGSEAAGKGSKQLKESGKKADKKRRKSTRSGADGDDEADTKAAEVAPKKKLIVIVLERKGDAVRNKVVRHCRLCCGLCYPSGKRERVCHLFGTRASHADLWQML